MQVKSIACPREHSAILSTIIKLPVVIKTFVLSIFEWPFYTGFTVQINTKIENYVIIASLKSETMGKLINRIPGSHLLISSLPGSALRTLVESLSKPRDVNKRSQSLAW